MVRTEMAERGKRAVSVGGSRLPRMQGSVEVSDLAETKTALLAGQEYRFLQAVGTGLGWK